MADALLVEDSFNRTDSTTNLGSTDGAGALDPVAWTQNNGTWGINTNQAYTSAGDANATATINAGTADVDITLTTAVRSGANGCGICLRWTSSANFVYLRNSSSGNTQLIKRVANVETSIIAQVAGAVNGDTLRVITVGNRYLVYRNGTLIMNGTDGTNFNLTATKHGLYNATDAGNANRLDNFSMSSASFGYDSLLIEMAFGKSFADTIVDADYTPVTAQRLSINRGRGFELDSFPAGTCSFTLADLNADFDPMNTLGQYYGQLLPSVPMRVTVRDGSGQRRTIFQGFVRQQGGYEFNRDANTNFVTINCADRFAFFALVTVPEHTEAEAIAAGLYGISSDFVTNLLTAYGGAYESTDDALTGSGETIFSPLTSGGDLLTILQTAAESEGGSIYITREGGVRWYGRLDALNAVAATIWDDTGTLGETFAIAGNEYAYADAIYNSASISRSVSDVPNTDSDATSIADYGESSFTRTGQYMESSAEAQARAEAIVSIYKDPHYHPKSIVTYPRRDNDQVSNAAQLDLNDLATIYWGDDGTGNQNQNLVFVEAIRHDIDFTRKAWTTTFGLSDAARWDSVINGNFFSLDSSTLDGSDVLAP